MPARKRLLHPIAYLIGVNWVEYPEAGNVGKHGVESLGVIGPLAPASSDEGPNYHSEWLIPVDGTPLGSGVYHVLHGEHHEITTGMDQYRLPSFQSQAQAGTGDHVLADGDFDDSVRE